MSTLDKTEEKIKEVIKEKIGNYRLFGQYFKEYNEDSKKPQLIWIIEKEDEIKTEGRISVLHIAPPLRKIQDSKILHKNYSMDWKEVLEYHDYIFGRIVRKWILSENKIIIDSLTEQSIKIDSTLEEFDEGKQPIKLLDEHKRHATTVLASFNNSYLENIERFTSWYDYGVEYRDEKGSAHIGSLRHLDVFGVPEMLENQLIIYDKEQIGLNISPIRILLETKYLLNLEEEINLWQIKPNSSVSIVLN